MGGPSDIELQSDEFISKWLDNEFSNSIERELFERIISRDQTHLNDEELQSIISRIDEQISAKAILNDFFRVDNVKPTSAKQTEIRGLVNRYLEPYLKSDLTRGYHEDFDEDSIAEDELLISKLIDGELTETESDNLIKRISESPDLNRLYEELNEDKEHLGVLHREQHVSDPVAARINEMVRGVLDEQSSDSTDKFPEAANYEPEPRMSSSMDFRVMDAVEIPAEDPWRHVGNDESTVPKPQSMNNKVRSYFGTNILQYAAIFAIGAIISPGILQYYGSINKPEGAITLRGIQPNLQGETNYLEILNTEIQLESLIVSDEGGNVLKNIQNTEKFFFAITPPIDGILRIYAEASELELPQELARGSILFEAEVTAGKTFKFPSDQSMYLDAEDRQLRVDLEINNINSMQKFTYFYDVKGASD